MYLRNGVKVNTGASSRPQTTYPHCSGKPSTRGVSTRS